MAKYQPKHAKIELKEVKVNKTLFVIFISVIVICIFAIAGFLIVLSHNTPEYEVAPYEAPKQTYYDFEQLQLTYHDIVGWIDIPNTTINMPIVQHPKVDAFYLSHDATGSYDINGAAYIELKNNKSFSDPVTMVYGHNMLNEKVFSTLHYFENPDFFNDNSEFVIYTPGHKLTYNIVSAYVYDDRHILNSFNMNDPKIREQYFQTLINPTSLVKNVRSGVNINVDDKIVQLSTCMSQPELDNQRYLVTGLLINDEEVTKPDKDE